MKPVDYLFLFMMAIILMLGPSAFTYGWTRYSGWSGLVGCFLIVSAIEMLVRWMQALRRRRG